MPKSGSEHTSGRAMAEARLGISPPGDFAILGRVHNFFYGLIYLYLALYTLISRAEVRGVSPRLPPPPGFGAASRRTGRIAERGIWLD